MSSNSRHTQAHNSLWNSEMQMAESEEVTHVCTGGGEGFWEMALGSRRFQVEK